MPSPTPKGLVVTGARARFTVNGQIVAYATEVSWTEDQGYEPIAVLDNIEVAEFAPISYTVSITAARVRLTGQSLRGPDLNILPKVGTDPATHLKNMLNQIVAGGLTIQVEDSVTGNILLIAEQAVITSHSIPIAARSLTIENVSIAAVRARDESES